MVINYFLIILIMLAAVFYIYKKYSSVTDISEDFMEDTDDDVDIKPVNPMKELEQIVEDEFARVVKQNPEDDGTLTRREMEQKKRRNKKLSDSIYRSTTGEQEATSFVTACIRDIVRREKDATTINECIPFDDDEALTPQDKWNLLLFQYMKLYNEDGLTKLIEEYEFQKPDRWLRRIVTDEKICEAYRIEKEKGNLKFNYKDKVNFVAERLFASMYGFGAVHSIYQNKIDEIDGGTSGVMKGSFRIRTNGRNLKYTKDSIWIVYHGLQIKLQCLSFGSNEELMRITNNVYMYDAPNVMSREDGKVVATMADGSRVVCVRPPFANTYAFFIRKFDSVGTETDLEKLYPGKNVIIFKTLMKWLVKGCRNIAVTGQQGSGKTTCLRALSQWIEDNLPIGVIEKQPELNLQAVFPDKSIVTLLETANISMQEALNLSKKMNRAVTIIGEAAEAIATSFVLQVDAVSSLLVMFTHHAKTVRDLIISFARDAIQIGLYNNKQDAMEAAIKALHFNLHMQNKKGDRHPRDLTEIIPVEQKPYPTQIDPEKYGLKDDILEFFRRMTDRVQYETRVIFEYKNGEYILRNMISEEKMEEIRAQLSAEEEEEFNADMEMIQKLAEQAEMERNNPEYKVSEETDNEQKAQEDNNGEETGSVRTETIEGTDSFVPQKYEYSSEETDAWNRMGIIIEKEEEKEQKEDIPEVEYRNRSDTTELEALVNAGFCKA